MPLTHSDFWDVIGRLSITTVVGLVVITLFAGQVVSSLFGNYIGIPNFRAGPGLQLLMYMLVCISFLYLIENVRPIHGAETLTGRFIISLIVVGLTYVMAVIVLPMIPGIWSVFSSIGGMQPAPYLQPFAVVPI